MARPGRNAPCPCGSGHKVKLCCGEGPRGPGEADLAHAALHREARAARVRLGRHTDERLEALADELIDLPLLDHSLLIALPRLITPDVKALQHAMHDDDRDAFADAYAAVAARCDTPKARLALLEAVQRLRDAGRLRPGLADTAAVDLTWRYSLLARSSLIEAVAVHAGAARTASGLLVAAR